MTREEHGRLRFRLRQGWLWWRDGNQLYFGITPGRSFRLCPAPPWIDRVLHRLHEGPASSGEVAEGLRGREAVSEGEIELFLRRLVDAGVAELVEATESRGRRSVAERYRRLTSFWGLWLPGEFPEEAAQHRIQEAHVAVLGCGGIGTHLALGLAATGVGSVTLIDYDTIEASNLNRQIMYGPGDIGRLKADVVSRSIRAQNPDVEVRTVPRRIRRPDDLSSILEDVDILFQTADEPPLDLALAVNTACLQAGVPWINSGTVEDLVEVGPLVVPGEPGCYRCWVEECQDEALGALFGAARDRQTYGFPSFEPLFSIASGIVLSEAVRWLLGVTPLPLARTVFRLQLADLRSWMIPITPRPACPDCGQLSNDPLPGELPGGVSTF